MPKVLKRGRRIVPVKRRTVAAEPCLQKGPEAVPVAGLFPPGAQIIQRKYRAASDLVKVDRGNGQAERILISHGANIYAAAAGEFHIPPRPGVDFDQFEGEIALVPFELGAKNTAIGDLLQQVFQRKDGAGEVVKRHAFDESTVSQLLRIHAEAPPPEQGRNAAAAIAEPVYKVPGLRWSGNEFLQHDREFKLFDESGCLATAFHQVPLHPMSAGEVYRRERFENRALKKGIRQCLGLFPGGDQLRPWARNAESFKQLSETPLVGEEIDALRRCAAWETVEERSWKITDRAKPVVGAG